MKQYITVFATLLLFLSPPVRAEETAYDTDLVSRVGFFYLGAGLVAGEYMDVKDDFEVIFATPVKVKEPIGVDLRTGHQKWLDPPRQKGRLDSVRKDVGLQVGGKRPGLELQKWGAHDRGVHS